MSACWIIANITDGHIQYSRTCGNQTCDQDGGYDCQFTTKVKQCSTCCSTSKCNGGIYTENIAIYHLSSCFNIIVLLLLSLFQWKNK
ncbi:hypothetical protein CHS0354_019302 [Potamilus streckersoni]|uniref:Uncharacterized protein n=1 Tax=Potamilus streckersoni TaxID=2493646 RepID=A0AAE0SHG5_9BIVA|nr:hypothetical protein CHS0354_019302 [Potamilus streckersoni]